MLNIIKNLTHPTIAYLHQERQKLNTTEIVLSAQVCFEWIKVLKAFECGLIQYYNTNTHIFTDDTEYEYYPDECLFHDVAAIPQRLLLDIIECYRQVKEYCMWCFYKDNKEVIIHLFPCVYFSSLCVGFC